MLNGFDSDDLNDLTISLTANQVGYRKTECYLVVSRFHPYCNPYVSPANRTISRPNIGGHNRRDILIQF